MAGLLPSQIFKKTKILEEIFVSCPQRELARQKVFLMKQRITDGFRWFCSSQASVVERTARFTLLAYSLWISI